MSEAATTTDVQTSVPAESVQPTAQGTNGKMSFDERIRTDPDFALQTVKNFQTKLNQATARLKPLEQLETVAKGTFGDVSEGVTQIIGLADRAYRIEQNPQWKQALEDMIAGKRVVPTDVESQPEEYLTPEERKIQALEAQITELRGQFTQHDTRMAQGELTNRLSSFFSSDLGQVLTPEEREDVVQTLQGQFKQWSSTEQGRSVLRNLQPDTIETVVVSRLHKDGKLSQVYDRIRQSKDQRRLGAATDSPSTLPTGAQSEHREFKNAADALRHAAKEFLTPETRQRLGW